MTDRRQTDRQTDRYLYQATWPVENKHTNQPEIQTNTIKTQNRQTHIQTATLERQTD